MQYGYAGHVYGTIDRPLAILLFSLPKRVLVTSLLDLSPRLPRRRRTPPSRPVLLSTLAPMSSNIARPSPLLPTLLPRLPPRRPATPHRHAPPQTPNPRFSLPGDIRIVSLGRVERDSDKENIG